jgi:hypothetical protein
MLACLGGFDVAGHKPRSQQANLRDAATLVPESKGDSRPEQKETKFNSSHRQTSDPIDNVSEIVGQTCSPAGGYPVVSRRVVKPCATVVPSSIGQVPAASCLLSRFSQWL